MRIGIALVFVFACGAGESPTPTETLCPDPDPQTVTYNNFGERFMADYCLQCHLSTLPRSQRNGAPLFHDFDSLLGIVQVSGHIDEQAGVGPAAANHFMPPTRCPSEPGGTLSIDCPQPTDDERRELAAWMACEVDRPHDF